MVNNGSQGGRKKKNILMSDLSYWIPVIDNQSEKGAVPDRI
jgi:hypothetical protein